MRGTKATRKFGLTFFPESCGGSCSEYCVLDVAPTHLVLS